MNKVVVPPKGSRIDFKIRVTEFRIGESVAEWILRLNAVFLVAPIAYEQTFAPAR